MNSMATQNSTRTGHRALDLPELFEAVSSVYPVLPIPAVFLFKTTANLREDVVKCLQNGNGKVWPMNVPKRNLGAVPWHRTFTPSRGVVPMSSGDVPQVSGECILIDPELLEEHKCIISHILTHSGLQQTHECAVIPIADAYLFMCSQSHSESWFESGSLDALCRLVPNSESGSGDEVKDSELPILIPENCTQEQEEELSKLFQTDWEFEPDFFRIPIVFEENDTDGTATKQEKNMTKIMLHLISRGWFPHDFIFVDDTTLSSLPIDTAALPTFLYATRLFIWHEAAKRQTVAIDNLGYAVGRLKMQREEDYSSWLGAFIKGIGLGHSVGDRETFNFYYWSCWKDEHGGVDHKIEPTFNYD